MSAPAPNLKELARACLARHRAKARAPESAGGPCGVGAAPGASWEAQKHRGHAEEHAAGAEPDGGPRRAEAEARPFECAVVEWLNRNPPPEQPDPSRCLVCGEAETEGRPLLPILAGDVGHRWLHDTCLEAHWRRRRAEAAAALGGPV